MWGTKKEYTISSVITAKSKNIKKFQKYYEEEIKGNL